MKYQIVINVDCNPHPSPLVEDVEIFVRHSQDVDTPTTLHVSGALAMAQEMHHTQARIRAQELMHVDLHKSDTAWQRLKLRWTQWWNTPRHTP